MGSGSGGTGGGGTAARGGGSSGGCRCCCGCNGGRPTALGAGFACGAVSGGRPGRRLAAAALAGGREWAEVEAPLGLKIGHVSGPERVRGRSGSCCGRVVEEVGHGCVGSLWPWLARAAASWKVGETRPRLKLRDRFGLWLKFVLFVEHAIE